MGASCTGRGACLENGYELCQFSDSMGLAWAPLLALHSQCPGTLTSSRNLGMMFRSSVIRTLTTNVGIMGLGLVNSVLLSRWLGPAGRGEVGATMLWPTLLVYLGSMGLISSVVYFSALPQSKAETIFGNSIVLAAFQSLLVLPLGYVLLPRLLSSQRSDVITSGRLFLLVIPISLVAQYGVGILQGRLHFTSFNWIRTIIPIGYLIGVVSLKTIGRLGLFEIILLHMGLQLLGLIVTLIALSKAGISLGLRTDRSIAKSMLRYGRRVQVGDVSQMANLRLDQILMAALLPAAQLGLYLVAVSSSTLTQVLSNTVRTVVTPSIAQKETTADKIAVLQGAFRKYLLLSLVAAVIIGAVLPVAIPIVYGSDFAKAIWPAEVLLFGTLLTGAKEVLSGGAQALGDPWLGSRAELVALVITAGVLPVLLLKFGILGAAGAAVAAYATQLAMVVYGLNHSHAISPRVLLGIKPRNYVALQGNW